jgi:hypothetical protein
MTLIADAKRRITLPPSVKPGTPFELMQLTADVWQLGKLRRPGKAPRRKSRPGKNKPKAELEVETKPKTDLEVAIEAERHGEGPLLPSERLELNELRFVLSERGKLGVLNSARLDHLESREG